MILDITDPITLYVKKEIRLSKKQYIKSVLKNILYSKRDKIIPFPYINEYFIDSFFSPNVTIKSYYGGGRIEIGTHNLIMNNFNIEAPSGNITIKDKTYIGGGTQINSAKSIYIGSNVLVAANCIIQDHNSHSLNYLERRGDIDLSLARFLGKPNMEKDFSKVKSASITIKDDVWIGHGSIILKGVTIGNRAIIGAGSVVTKDIPDDGVVAGNPASLIRLNKI